MRRVSSWLAISVGLVTGWVLLALVGLILAFVIAWAVAGLVDTHPDCRTASCLDAPLSHPGD